MFSVFDPVAAHLAPHDAGVGSSASGWEQFEEQLVADLAQGVSQRSGGKSPRAWWSHVGRLVACG